MSLATKHRLAHWSYSIHCALQPMPFHSFPIMTACQQRTPYSTPLCQHTRRCILICRQQETGLQCKPGSRGHHAHSLGQPEQHRSICVLDMDLKNGPVQIDNNDLNQTNHGHAQFCTSRTAPSLSPTSCNSNSTSSPQLSRPSRNS
jgi:hypothetical protein